MKMVVALNLPKSAERVCIFARSVVTAMTGNTSFPSPSPALAKVTADTDAVEQGNAAVLTRAKGATAARNVRLAVLLLDMNHLKAYVQAIADADPANAAAIIESAGMSVKKPSLKNKVPLKVVQGEASGSVKCNAKAKGDRASYEFQYSLDRKTWIRAIARIEANAVITGLTPGLMHYFRVGITTIDNGLIWSDAVSLIVQ